MYQEYHQSRKVGREVDYLGCTGCLVQADMSHGRKKQHQECTCARAIEAIVDADEESQRQDNQHGFTLRERGLVRLQGLLAKHVASRQRQDHQHDNLEGIGLDQQRQTGTQPRATQGSNYGRKHPLPMDETTSGVMPGSHHRTQTSTELIRTDSRMRWKAGNQVSRERNQSATSGNGINEARQEHQRAHNQVFNHNSIIIKSSCLVVLSKAKDLTSC